MCWFAANWRYGGGVYYSPLSRWLFVAVCAFGDWGLAAWSVLVAAAAVAAAPKVAALVPGRAKWAILLPLAALAAVHDVHPVVLWLSVRVYYRSRGGWGEGLLLGALTFNPVCSLLVPYAWLEAPQGRRAALLAGVAVGVIANWGWLLFDYPMLESFVASLLRGAVDADPISGALGYLYWSWAVYPWLNLAHYHHWVRLPRQQRAAQLAPLPA